jgi:hypothetical protein
VSGRRAKGREAIACDVIGAFDVAPVTVTLSSRGRRLTLRRCDAAGKPVQSVDRARFPGALCRVGPQGRSPTRAQRSHLDLLAVQFGNAARSMRTDWRDTRVPAVSGGADQKASAKS